jgi:acetyl-CoA carboxylase biotin carboxyl carrier protein
VEIIMSDIHSPIPGIFYRRPSTEEEPFVEVGTNVEPDTVIGLVEVMKSFHKVQAQISGKVKSIEVENEGMVRAGDVLMKVDP